MPALIAKADQDGEIAKALVLRPGTPDLVVRKLLSAPPIRQGTGDSPTPSAAAPVPEAAAGSAKAALPRPTMQTRGRRSSRSTASASSTIPR